MDLFLFLPICLGDRFEEASSDKWQLAATKPVFGWTSKELNKLGEVYLFESE
jgi:hypothetical protein